MTYITFLHAHHVDLDATIAVGKRADRGVNQDQDQDHVLSGMYLDAVS